MEKLGLLNLKFSWKNFNSFLMFFDKKKKRMDLVHTPNAEKDFASAAVSCENQEAKSFSRKKEMDETMFVYEL